MRFAEYNAYDVPDFSIEDIKRRQKEALGTKVGPQQFQGLAAKIFPLFQGRSIDACFLVAMFLLTFTLRVMQDRENEGKSPSAERKAG